MAKSPTKDAAATAAADQAAADQAAADKAAAETAAAPAAEQGTGKEAAKTSVPVRGAQGSRTVVVHCPIAGGRRRAGRRWPGGETRVAAEELSKTELEQLRADPLLRVDVQAV